MVQLPLSIIERIYRTAFTPLYITQLQSSLESYTKGKKHCEGEIRSYEKQIEELEEADCPLDIFNHMRRSQASDFRGFVDYWQKRLKRTNNSIQEISCLIAREEKKMHDYFTSFNSQK